MLDNTNKEHDDSRSRTPHSTTPIATPGVSEKYDPYQVTLEDADSPVFLPLWRRWAAALIINAGAICVTGASAMVSDLQHPEVTS